MDSRPVYLHGRGRGRGRGRAPVVASGVDYRSHTQNSRDNALQAARSRDYHSTDNARGGQRQVVKQHSLPEVTSEGKFEEAAAKHQESVQRHLAHNFEDVEDSSEEDEDDLDDDGILQSVLKSFTGHTGSSGDLQDLGRTQDYLLNTVKTKANVCLICIETIKRNDPIWSCQGCYSMFHISCIQKWVKDGVYQNIGLSEENFPNRDLPWNCPKCRFEYKQSQCPTRYVCFCGKEEDPEFDPWLVPHSCGQGCGKKLKPQCGHTCLLLCHPGPCPPCPQTVQIRCYCQKQPAQIRRCGTREWSCGQICGRALSCGHHVCSAPCHPGECPACQKSSTQKCQCGRMEGVQPCAKPQWHCEQICGKPLPCGHHVCETVCHSGDCGTCPRSGNRSCPCGKSVVDLPCTEDVPTCVETCDKLMDCGLHMCTQRCHTGPCGTCREMTVKTCYCGRKKKEIQCFKEFRCETKCAKMRDCGKHNCRRKCCDGDCPPCEQTCGKPLGCRNHKCSSRCHKGPCYPCPLTVSISCSCGTTTVTVPCGREKITPPPRCSKPCKTPPDCHHPLRIKHKCHRGACNPCRQICMKQLPRCQHACPAPCHSAVKTKIQEKVQRAGPWEAKPETRIELVDMPCPPCLVPTPVTCLGGHETATLACHAAVVASCHRPCGRLLSCTNHSCQLDCHKVVGAKDKQTAGNNCQKCEETCGNPRPEGCTHICLLPCHPGECPPCPQMIRMRCHCQMMVLHVECDSWCHAEDSERDRLKSCHGICPKMLSCNHQCKSACHPPPCPSSSRCTEKVKVRCPCRRKKQDYLCNEVKAGYANVTCDELCHQHKEIQKKKREEEEKLKQIEDEKRRQKELEEFERKMGKRGKRKRGKPRTEEEEPRFLQKYGKFIVVPFLVVLLAGFLYYLFNK